MGSQQKVTLAAGLEFKPRTVIQQILQLLNLHVMCETDFFLNINHIFIYGPLSVFRPVIFLPVVLSSCHICGALSYSLCFSHQTDQGDKTESFEREGLEIKR
jgi:hypothetical protein